jgi:hypothetical protein
VKELQFSPRTNDIWYIGFGAGNGNLGEFNFLHVTGSTTQRMLTITSAETIELNYHRLQNVDNPINSKDAANKEYTEFIGGKTYFISEDDYEMYKMSENTNEVWFGSWSNLFPGASAGSVLYKVSLDVDGDASQGYTMCNNAFRMPFVGIDSNGVIYWSKKSGTSVSLGCTQLPSGGGGGSSTSLSLGTGNTGNHYLIGCNSTSTSSVALTSSNTHRAGAGTGAGIYWSGWELYASSDERLKDFYGDIDVDFDKIKSLPKKYFKWKNEGIDGSKMNIGTSAQKVKEVYPELVSNGDDGTLGVCYEKLSVVALAAVDKLHEENEELKKKYEDLENRLKELEKLLLK